MTNYDPLKYQEKRERVLGVRKKGLGFGTWAALVSMAIVLSLGIAVAPKAIAYLSTRGLDDVIFKVHQNTPIEESLLTRLTQQAGVRLARSDKNHTRLIVTFDRNASDPARITSFLHAQGIDTVLLNRINHRQRTRTLEEEAEFETP